MREAEHRDEAEEAVEDEQEDRDDAAGRPSAAFFACVQRVLAERRRDVGALDLLELTGSAPVWSTSARSFASLKRADAGDLRAVAPGRSRRGFCVVVDRAGTT